MPSRPVPNPLDDLMAAAARSLFVVTQFTKLGITALSKRVSLGADAKPVSDGSECVMANCTAVRRVVDLRGFAALIESCTSQRAISLGTPRSDLPDEQLSVVTKNKWNKLRDSPGAKGGTVICRTADFFEYQKRMGVSLLDYDTKGQPKPIEDRVAELGGVWQALTTVVPEMAGVAHVDRPSTSTGLYNLKTGEEYPGSRGQHIYPLLIDASDNERFLRRLHDCCWLADSVLLGWMMLGADGSFLNRSVVDRMVYGPEQFSFESDPRS
jgi:hypothetical protein